MLQAKHLMATAALCTASLVASLPANAEDTLAEFRTPMAPAENALEVTAVPTAAAAAPNEVSQADILECPPGQFPSAFSDVYPFHWAYEAVNNFASPSMQCFELPEEFR